MPKKSKDIAGDEERERLWAPYGWLHSCGRLFYQLDHPCECECGVDGNWEWYENEQ